LFFIFYFLFFIFLTHSFFSVTDHCYSSFLPRHHYW